MGASVHPYIGKYSFILVTNRTCSPISPIFILSVICNWLLVLTFLCLWVFFECFPSDIFLAALHLD
jgi:hypothetical protein